MMPTSAIAIAHVVVLVVYSHQRLHLVSLSPLLTVCLQLFQTLCTRSPLSPAAPKRAEKSCSPPIPPLCSRLSHPIRAISVMACRPKCGRLRMCPRAGERKLPRRAMSEACLGLIDSDGGKGRKGYEGAMRSEGAFFPSLRPSFVHFSFLPPFSSFCAHRCPSLPNLPSRDHFGDPVKSGDVLLRSS